MAQASPVLNPRANQDTFSSNSNSQQDYNRFERDSAAASLIDSNEEPEQVAVEAKEATDADDEIEDANEVKVEIEEQKKKEKKTKKYRARKNRKNKRKKSRIPSLVVDLAPALEEELTLDDFEEIEKLLEQSQGAAAPVSNLVSSVKKQKKVFLM